VRKDLATIALAAVVLLAFLLLVFHLHEKSREKVLSQFNEYQLLTTQQVAKSVERYFLARSQDLESLTDIVSRQAFDRDKITAAIQSDFKSLKINHIQDVSFLNKKGTVVYSTTAGAERENHSQTDFFAWARNPGNKGVVRMWWQMTEGQRIPVSPGSPAFPHIGIFLATPLYEEFAAGGKFAGVLMFTVDLEKMLAERSPLLTPAAKLHKLWIIERGGTLLEHSEHPEMVMRDIRKRDETCNECHTSFDYLEKILEKAEGTVEYQIKGERRKVAAFTSMTFLNSPWIIVMNTPLDEVTAFQRENLKDTILLLGTVVFLLGLAFFFTYGNYRKRLAGEMEVKRLQGYEALTEKLRRTLRGTIQVISRAVEMRDPYTAGHQRRAADLARAIATQMGLSADRTDFIRIACTIHDIGNIAVPAEILSKTKKLTDIEFSLIKTHVQYGYDILKNIEFPWPVADVILQHHERLDGSGYPHGLKRDDILMESKILAVADVVEAMISHRPYRHALGSDAALEEITKNRGTLYDPKVVDTCLQLFNDKGYKFVDQS
jgi:HD-GYP domain-containing protein (c-di-GMP phosphodiesterase class II)